MPKNQIREPKIEIPIGVPLNIEQWNALCESRKRGPNKRTHPESKLQRACIGWFDQQYPAYKQLLFAIPNGGKRSKIEAAIMTGEGVRPGVADLFLAVPQIREIADGIMVTAGLFIEMKCNSNKQTDYQKLFQAAVEKKHYRYEVIEDSESFIRLINDYLK